MKRYFHCCRTFMFWLSVLYGLISISACQSISNIDDRSVMLNRDILSHLDISNAVNRNTETDIPNSVSEILLPSLNMKIKKPQPVAQQRFDINVKQASLQSFLMSLVQDTPYNMVVHPSVKGEISLSLKNVSLIEVMDALRDVYGYEYTRTSNGFEIQKPALRSQIFQVDYLNVKRNGVSQIRVSSGQISNQSSGQTQQKKNAKSANTAASQNLVSGSQVDTRSYSEFWKELKSALAAIIGTEGGRNVVINAQSGMVVVRAMPTELREVGEYLKATQSIIHRQVILEAKILEVELSDGFQSGINWSSLAERNGKTALFSQTGGGSIFNGSGLSGIAGNNNELIPGPGVGPLSGIVGNAAAAFGGVFSMALNLNDFSAFIEALSSQGEVHVLSSPRVSTVNNQKAVIKVGADEFFVTDLTTETTESSGATNQSVNVELTPFFSGVALDVIPQIDANGMVTLHVHPSVSEVIEKVKQINVSTSSTLSVPLALSTIRESDSIVRAKSGQVVVIGGLMQNSTQDSTAGIPILSKLPFIGGIFEHEKQSMRKSELVILIKPVVIKNDTNWDQFVSQSHRRISNMVSIQPSND